MAGLAVEGFTVEWGADTRQYEMANKRVRDDAKKTAFTVEKEFESATKKTMKQFLGFSNIAKATFAGVGGAVAIGVKGSLEFAKANEEAGRELAAMQKSAKDFWVSIGADASGAFGVIKDGIDLMKDARNFFVDLFQGEGTSAMLKAALDERAKQTKDNAARQAGLDKAKDARKEFLGMQAGDPANVDAKRAQIDAEFKEATKGVAAELASGDQIRIRAALELLKVERDIAGTKVRAAEDEADEFWKGVGEKLRAKEKDKADAVAAEQAESERRQKERDQEKERVNAQKMEIDDLRESARLTTLRATGRGKEADAAEIQAQYEKDIARVRDTFGIDFDQKLSTIDALQQARDAELGALNRSTVPDIGGSLASGSFSGQAFAQAFGGSGANLKADVEKNQLKVLEEIAKNTRTPAAVMVP